jgi:hypothetical protein
VSGVRGTAADPEMLASLSRVEADNKRFAMLWRGLIRGDDSDRSHLRAEQLRRTARAAVEDWIEARDGGR